MEYIGTSKKSYSTFLSLEADFIKVHGSTYDYSKVSFYNARTPVTILCKEHGEFSQRPRDHKRGQGCRKCYDEREGKVRQKPLEQVKAELLEVGKYNYPDIDSVEYLGAFTKIMTECVVCGCTKKHRINSILTGHSGCKVCATSKKLWTEDRYENLPTMLYYIRIGELYKIGLTRKTVASSFYKELSEGYDIEVIFTILYANGAEAFKEEQRIKSLYREFRYKGEKVLINGGDSELFTMNVLEKYNGGVI